MPVAEPQKTPLSFGSSGVPIAWTIPFVVWAPRAAGSPWRPRSSRRPDVARPHCHARERQRRPMLTIASTIHASRDGRSRPTGCATPPPGLRVPFGGSPAAEAARSARPRWPGRLSERAEARLWPRSRRWPLVNGVDDLGVIDPAQVHRRDPEIGMLDMRVICGPARDLVVDLSAWGLTLLVRRYPTANAGGIGRCVELNTDPGGRTRPTAGRAPQHAKQRPDRERRAELKPRVQLLLMPSSA